MFKGNAIIALTKAKSRAPDYNKITWPEPVIQLKTNLKKHVSLRSLKLEPGMLSGDIGLCIPCFDSCQSTITLMFNITDACCKLTNNR